MMATKTFSGQLDQAIEGAASGNRLLFVPQENLGEVLMGAASEMVVGDDGTYSITLAYNTYSVYHYSDVTKCKILIADGVEVSASTSVSTIPDLIGVSVPVTDSDVLTNQGYLQEGQDYAASAKSSASASASLYNNFNKKIGQAIEPIETGVPSLDIPFNDSGILKKGAGNEYVSGLPVYGVGFTRSTTSTVINKSGALETLASDEMGIGADGVWLHGAYTNHITYSEPDGSNWPIVNQSSTWANSLETHAGVVFDEVVGTPAGFVDASTSESKITTSFFFYDNGDNSSDGDRRVFIIQYRNATDLLSEISIRYDYSDFGSFYTTDDYVAGLQTEYLSDNVIKVTIITEYTPADSTTVRLFLSPYSHFISGVQLVDGVALDLPYLPTTSTTATATATSCTVPVSGNLPATGKSCAWVVDTNVPEVADSNRALLSISGSSTSGNFAGFVVTASGLMTFRAGSNGVGDVSFGSVSDNSAYIDGGQNRFSFVYDADDETVTAYVNGNPNSTGAVSVSGMTFPSDGVINLGESAGTWRLNAQLKNFKILPYAASADEVKSWGAPK